MNSLSRRSVLALGLFGVVGALSTAGCGPDKEKEADELFEDEQYEEALEIYEELDSTDEIEEKIASCRFWLFVEYARSDGKIDISTTNDTGALVQYTIEARSNGDIRLFSRESYLQETPRSTYEYTIDIEHGEELADISANYEMTDVTLGVVNQTAEGIFDIGTYSYGDSINWDETTDNVTLNSGTQSVLGFSMLSNCGPSITFMIEQLAAALERSGSGCTLQDIGFANLE